MFRIFCLLFLFIACASSDEEEEEYTSNAHPAAYAAESFNVFPPSPKRERNTKQEFYFKDCSPTGGKTHYSNTSYFCDDISP